MLTVSQPLQKLSGKVMSIVPFGFKGITECDAIVAMPPTFKFTKEILNCVEDCLGIKAFDAFAIPSFSKKLLSESHTVFQTLNIADKKHKIKKIILFQTSDSHEEGNSFSYSNQVMEDGYHIAGLLKSRDLILHQYPRMEVTLVYVTLKEGQQHMVMSEVHPNGERETIFRAEYRFRGVYNCDTALIRCIEFRTRKQDRSFVRNSLKIPTFGLIGLPGASKRFLEDSQSAWEAINLACNTDGCKKIILMHHADCGAYGGVACFDGDAVSEEIMHRGEMYKLRDMIHKKYPNIEVVLVYVRLIHNQTKLQYVLFD